MALMAGCFSLSQDSCSSRDGAESRHCRFWIFGNARINPETYGGRHLRVRTAPRFSKPPYFSVADPQFECPRATPTCIQRAPVALGELAAVTLSRDLPRKTARGARKRNFCDWRREHKVTRAPLCCAARRTCQANEIVFHIRRLLKPSKNLFSWQ